MGPLSELREMVKEKRGTKWYVVLGDPPSALEYICTMVAKEACQNDDSARVVTLMDLIDIEFAKGDDGGLDPRKVGVLCLKLGSEPAHKWNKVVVEKILKYRWDRELLTVVIAEEDIDRLDSYYRSRIVTEFLTDRLTRIMVRKRLK
jgi:hypothetical protein